MYTILTVLSTCSTNQQVPKIIYEYIYITSAVAAKAEGDRTKNNTKYILHTATQVRQGGTRKASPPCHLKAL